MLRLYYARKNRYFRRSRLSEAKFKLIMRYFTHDLPTSKLAALSDVSRPTINQRSFKLRTRIAQIHYASSPFSGEVEVDESSFFGARRVRGKRGVEPGVKQSPSESWNGRERSTRRSSRMPPRSRYRPRFGARHPRSLIHSDGWRDYNGLVDMGYSGASPRPSVTNLREAIALSTALNHSGHLLNEGLQNSRAFPDIHFIYTSKNVNSDFIIERKISRIKYSLLSENPL